MNKKKIIYFSLSVAVLFLISIILVYEEQPAEIPTVRTVSVSDTDYYNSNQEIISEFYCEISESIVFSTDITKNYQDISESEESMETCVSIIENNDETSENPIAFPLNLNTARKDELMQVEGIGEVLAERIIEYRNQNGDFTSMYQLTEINGIGDAKFEKFRSFLYIENEQEYFNEDNQPVEEQNNENYEEPADENYDEPIEPVEETQVIIEETILEETEIPMIELNSATAEDFMKLPNIDEEMALKIVDFRSKIQYFSHPYELLYIDGMSENLLASVIDYMYIEGKEDIIY